MTDVVDLLFERFLAAAESVVVTRPEVDVELARELMLEAATVLHNGLVLDDLDEHDARAVIDGLAVALVDRDPAAAVRARSQATRGSGTELHDPERVSATYLFAAATLQL